MAGGAEDREHFAQGRVGAHADDVGARHHHIGHTQLVEGQDILENQPFLRREII
jgi:hypothetical protein